MTVYVFDMDKIVFFGDKTFAGGNDFKLTQIYSSLTILKFFLIEFSADVLKYLLI